MQRALRLVYDLRRGCISEARALEEGTRRRTILLLPRTKTVTVLAFAHSSMTNILSLVVPKDTSRTMPALPSFSAVRSSKRGTIRPFVAMAMS